MKFYAQQLSCMLLLFCAAMFSVAAADEFLDPEQAFKASATLTETRQIHLSWKIAPGYKLYRGRIHFSTDNKDIVLEVPALPTGIRKFDENFGQDVEIYHDKLDTNIAIISARAPFTLSVEYQGCAEAGLCYPPVTKKFLVNPRVRGLLSPVAESNGNASNIAVVDSAMQKTQSSPENDTSLAQRTLHNGSLTGIALAFLSFGLLLSLTPCVLPMVPILSSIIVGEGQVTRRRGFLLALAYSFGMALVYTSMGVAAGLAGEGLAAALQKPWVLVSFALVLTGLALSMFDVYQLLLPASLQTRLSLTSDRLHGGRFMGVLLMGAVSALIVGPCVAAPLAGALVYISQTHDVLLGGWALFCMAIGMSVPLLLTGISAGSLLPRVGGWMEEVKHLFGFMLIAVAIWMVTPVLAAWTVMLVWGAFALLCAVFLRTFEPIPANAGLGARLVKATGLVFLFAGVFELLGAASGGRDVLLPLAHISVANATTAQPAHIVQFTRINKLEDLEQYLRSAQTPILLDFYADWCVACKEMERYTFSDARVSEKLLQFKVLQVDVTFNDPDQLALMKKFGLFGPPGIILFNAKGEELRDGRVIGYVKADAFLDHLEQHLHSVKATSKI